MSNLPSPPRCTCALCRAHDEILARDAAARDAAARDPRDVPPCGADKHRQMRTTGLVTCLDCGERV